MYGTFYKKPMFSYINKYYIRSFVGDLIKITSEDGKDSPIVPCDPDGTKLKAHLTNYKNTVVLETIVSSISRERDGNLNPKTTSRI